MIEERAVISRIENNYVWVNTQRQSSCGHCSAQKGCGTQVLSQMFGNRLAQFRCLNLLNEQDEFTDALKVGDEVIIGLPESALLGGSLLIYFVPMISMIFFAAGSVYLAKIGGVDALDWLTIPGAILGLVSGFFMSRRWSTKYLLQKHYEPRVIRKSIQPQAVLTAVNFS